MYIAAIIVTILLTVGFIWWLTEIIPTAIYYPFLYTTGQWAWMSVITILIGIAIIIIYCWIWL